MGKIQWRRCGATPIETYAYDPDVPVKDLLDEEEER